MRIRSLSRHTLALCFGCQAAAARLLHSLPEDTYAFPKYRVSFLNGLPILKETAERWLQEGLRGGESEFLDQPWEEGNWHAPPPLKGIGDGEAGEPDYWKPSNVTLERMKMGPDDSHICLIPPAPESPAPHAEEQQDATPAQSWALLKPLSGKCLYHRQPWFTYSYCHNQEIRQFRELPPSQPHPPGGYQPTEDPEWESYTLGRAPPVPEPGVDLTVAQESALAANLELARGAGSRYLVQRWGDGEICDKTGKPREVEVQFHCSMTTTDTIILVREAKTCSYVLVVHTPRLCGEPGFKSRLEARDESYIRCRKIVESIDRSTHAENPLAGADRPLNKMTPRQPLLTVPARPPTSPPAGDAGSGTGQAQQDYNERLRKMLEAVLGNKVNGEFIIEQINVDPAGQEDLIFQVDLNDLAADEQTDEHTGHTGIHPSLLEALRAAGIDVKGEKTDDKSKEDKKEQKKADGGQLQERDEL